MLEEKQQSLIVYLSILITPLLYLFILGALIFSIDESTSFSDYTLLIIVYSIGMITTYILSIPYTLKAYNEEIAREKAIIKLSIFHIPTLLGMLYSILVIVEAL